MEPVDHDLRARALERERVGVERGVEGELPHGQALRYYDTLRREGRVVFTARQPVRTFSFDSSFNSYPLSFKRPGPEIVIYRLTGGACRGR